VNNSAIVINAHYSRNGKQVGTSWNPANVWSAGVWLVHV